MPDRTIKVFDLAGAESRDMETGRAFVADAIAFSPNGSLLAAVEHGNYQALNVYDVATGARIASISLVYAGIPKLAPLANGRGFATVEQTGRIAVYPLFENPHDLIAYLAREFPERLTPAQRRAYFID
jgi:hypothetical protein